MAHTGLNCHIGDRFFLNEFLDKAKDQAAGYINKYNAIYKEKGRREANLAALNWTDDLEDNALILSLKFEHPAIANYLDNAYHSIQRKEGREKAKSEALKWQNRLMMYRIENALPVTASDDDIREFCKRKAYDYSIRLGNLLKAKTFKQSCKSAAAFVDRFIPFPYPKNKNAAKEHWQESLVRPKCEQWWRRQVRVLCRRGVESLLRELGFIGAGNQPYCSDWCLFERTAQNSRNKSALENTEAENQYGQVYTLAELAATGVSNQTNRRNELMTMIRGLEEYAQLEKEVGVFVTLTTPSRFHAKVKTKTGSIKNNKYNGSSPRDAQAWLVNAWARQRAALDRKKIDVYGYRVAEPHHDGTPHWHMLLFMPLAQVREFNRIMKFYALQEDGHENGAQKNRYLAKLINPKKGTASGYIAKYIAKNIDGFAISEQVDDETGNNIEQSVSRVAAWSACWGIRQFQQIGGAGKTIWRELRKITREKMATYQRALPEDVRWSNEEMEEVDKVRSAADEGNYRAYTDLQGGAHVKLKEQTVRLWKMQTNIPGKYQTMIAQLFNGIFYKGIELLKGIFLNRATDKKRQLTNYYEWTLRYINKTPQSSFKDGHSPSSWLSANFCLCIFVNTGLDEYLANTEKSSLFS